MRVQRDETVYIVSPSLRSGGDSPRSLPANFFNCYLVAVMFHLINNVMDKFAVLCKIGSFKPSVEETFSNVADASAYVNIMRRKNDGHEYTVWQINEEL